MNLPLRAVFAAAAVEPPAHSFFEVNRSEVQLLAFKPAEFRPGWYVLRFQEISGQAVKGVKLTTPLRMLEAVAADTVERPGAPIDLSNFSVPSWGTVTVLVRVNPF